MKKLFEVAGKYFENKADARAYRKSINPKDKETGKEILSATIALGPDHWRYAG